MTSPTLRTTLARLAAGAALLTAPLGAGAQTPAHLYNLTGGSLADALGGPSLALFGTNTPGTLGAANGYYFAAGGGFTLENALASPSVYSVELSFLFDETAGYRRILDFKNRATDAGFYDEGTAARFYNITSGPAGAFANGTMANVVVTRDAGGVFTAYVNGAQQFSFTDAGGNASFTGPNAIIHFLHDDASVGGEQSSGFVDYIRIYDEALSARQVAALAPPGVTAAPEPATMALLATGLLAVGGIARRRRHA
jgi:hypothetical protein